MENLLSSSSFTYDVCLAYFGDDERNSFTRNLVKALNERGIRTFINEDKVSTLSAIQESRTAIIIFSENISTGLPYHVSSLFYNGMHAIITPVFINTNPSQVKETAFEFQDPYESDSDGYYEYRLEFFEHKYFDCCKVAEKPGWYFKDGYLPDH